MPIYGYQCGECSHELEALQKISEAPLQDCPSCNKPALTKQVTAPGFRLSGSGWYETDFKTGAKKNLAGDSKATRSSGRSSDGSAGSSKSSTAGSTN